MKTMKKIAKVFVFVFALALAIIFMFYLVFNIFTRPSNDRNWTDDQSVLPFAEKKGDLVTIRNVRNFTYEPDWKYSIDYYDKTYDLSEIKKVWYMVEPFRGIPGSAHTLLSFEFEGDEFVAISAEIRKEEGESFHPIKGLFNRYELMYVVADEKDVIRLRTNFRKNLVYLYPMKADQEKVAELFVDMISRVNKLKDSPEFYNTITNTCTTNIASHVRKLADSNFPILDWRIVFPARSDELAYELGLIDTDLSFEEAKQKYFINDLADANADSADFSAKIRGR